MRDSKKGNEEAQRGVAKGSQGRNKKGKPRTEKRTAMEGNKGGHTRTVKESYDS